MPGKCKLDISATTLSQAFGISENEYKKIATFVLETLIQTQSVSESIIAIRKKYRNQCKYELAIFILGRAYERLWMLMEHLQTVVSVPYMEKTRDDKNGNGNIWQ